MSICYTVLAAAALAFVGCAPSSTPRDTAADSAAVHQAMDAYVTTALSNDVAAISAFWTDDAVFLNTGMPTIRGRISIDSLIQSMRAAMQVTGLEVQLDEVTVSGDAAYMIGTFHETLVPNEGPTQEVTGRFLQVWRRQSDGSWKIARSMGN